MTTRSTRASLLLALCQACAHRDPSPDLQREDLLVAATAVLAADSTLLTASLDARGSNSTPWSVVGPGINRESDAVFERAILRAVRGRTARVSDSTAHTLLATELTVRGDSGFVRVDRGSRMCTSGTVIGGGTVSLYAFHLEGRRWNYLWRRDEVTYDPAIPLPEAADPAACARAMNRK